MDKSISKYAYCKDINGKLVKTNIQFNADINNLLNKQSTFNAIRSIIKEDNKISDNAAVLVAI